MRLLNRIKIRIELIRQRERRKQLHAQILDKLVIRAREVVELQEEKADQEYYKDIREYLKHNPMKEYDLETEVNGGKLCCSITEIKYYTTRYRPREQIYLNLYTLFNEPTYKRMWDIIKNPDWYVGGCRAERKIEDSRIIWVGHNVDEADRYLTILQNRELKERMEGLENGTY